MPHQEPFDQPTIRRDDDTRHPENPPNAVVGRGTRRLALFTYLGALVATFAIVGVALLFWLGRDDGFGSGAYGIRGDTEQVGTSGERMPREDTPGGFDPTPDFDDTRNEIEFRGGGDDAAERITLEDVQVERADGDTFVVRDDNELVTVVSAGGMPTVKRGQRVNVTGTVEDTPEGRRLRASRIDVR